MYKVRKNTEPTKYKAIHNMNNYSAIFDPIYSTAGQHTMSNFSMMQERNNSLTQERKKDQNNHLVNSNAERMTKYNVQNTNTQHNSSEYFYNNSFYNKKSS